MNVPATLVLKTCPCRLISKFTYLKTSKISFIAAVFDYLTSPSNLPCRLNGNIALLLSRNRLLMQFMALWLTLLANAYCLWSLTCVKHVWNLLFFSNRVSSLFLERSKLLLPVKWPVKLVGDARESNTAAMNSFWMSSNMSICLWAHKDKFWALMLLVSSQNILQYFRHIWWQHPTLHDILYPHVSIQFDW